MNTAEKELFITFDDGPTPEITPWVLQTLKEYNAKATFFCIGKNIKNHPDIFQQILLEGHSIGNHSQNHIKGWKTNTRDYLDDVSKAEAEIEKYYDLNNLFRPPYGQLKLKQGWKLKKRGYHIIMWDVLSFDWNKNLSQKDCLDNVISKSINGSIVVFHDSQKAFKNLSYVLPKTLDYFGKKKYKFKALNL